MLVQRVLKLIHKLLDKWQRGSYQHELVSAFSLKSIKFKSSVSRYQVHGKVLQAIRSLVIQFAAKSGEEP